MAIDTPDAPRERPPANAAAANRVFCYTIRFRQKSAPERLRWLTESYHRHAPLTNAFTTSLVAEHP